MLILLLILFTSCAAQNPDVALVGSSVPTVVERLGIREASWDALSTPGYEISYTSDQEVSFFGQKGTAWLTRRGDTVAAIDFRIRECTPEQYDALRKTVLASYGLEPGEGPDVYAVLRRGVVHLRPTSDGGARLVLTDEEYGDVYVDAQLREGFTNLSNGMRPH